MAHIGRVALVVPCFNEASRLPVPDFLGPISERMEVELVLVDDGSTDQTRALLEQVRDRRRDTVVVSYDDNRGKGEAVRRGVLDALARRPDAVGFWDADLATPLAELDAFVEVLEKSDHADVVLGSRVKLMGRSVERRAWRHYMGRLFATTASLTLDLPVYDTQCGAKLFRATPLVERVFERPFLTRWLFDVEILARFLALDPRGREAAAQSLHELPLRKWSDVGGSKLRAKDFARAALDLAMIRRVYPPHGRGQSNGR